MPARGSPRETPAERRLGEIGRLGAGVEVARAHAGGYVAGVQRLLSGVEWSPLKVADVAVHTDGAQRGAAAQLHGGAPVRDRLATQNQPDGVRTMKRSSWAGRATSITW